MMSFCKKSVHSFLAISNPLLNIDTVNPYEKTSSNSPLHIPSKGVPDGLGFISSEAAGTLRMVNVLESTTLKYASSSSSFLSLLSPSSTSMSSMPSKKDPGGIGFIDDIGGGVDGLMSCTESLGFESSDERRVDDEIELCSSDLILMSNVKRRKYERREVKKFPPPLSSFNHNGQPSFFLKPIRRDGRLELTEVRIDRPEILRASREDGRLKLHLVIHEEEEEDDNNNEFFNIEEDENLEEIEGKKEKEEVIEEEEEEEEEKVEKIFEEEKLGKEEIEEWRISSMNDDSFVRRCHDDVVMIAHHHHHHREYHHHHHHHHGNHRNDHHMHVWSQQCVTTR